MQTGTTWLPLFQFICYLFPSWLIFLARNSSNILNKNRRNRHPYCKPDLRGSAFSFPLSSILDTGLSYRVLIMLWYNPIFMQLLSWKDTEFHQRLLVQLLKMIMVGCCCYCFVFVFVLWCWGLNPGLHAYKVSTLSLIHLPRSDYVVLYLIMC